MCSHFIWTQRPLLLSISRRPVCWHQGGSRLDALEALVDDLQEAYVLEGSCHALFVVQLLIDLPTSAVHGRKVKC